MAKVLALRLNQCFGPFTMLPVEGSSRAGLFRHLSNHVFRGLYFRKYISYEGHLNLRNFKVWCRFWKCTKNLKKNLFFRSMYLNCLHLIVSTQKRMFVIRSQSVNKRSEVFACHYKWLFPTHLPSQWSTNMVKKLPLRLNQCFGPFTMLPVEGSSQTGLFSQLSNHVFRGP